MDWFTAFRQLRRAPATSLAAVITLAVGIGTTTAVFVFRAAVMSAASPAPDMERLVAVWSHQQSEADTKGLATPAEFLEWSSRTRAFEAVSAWRSASFNVTGTGSPLRLSAQLVTPQYFQVFGWRPALGRVFTDEDSAPGAPKVVVASYTFWQNVLGGRPDIVGYTLRLDGEPAVVVGVLPRMPAAGNFFVPLALANQRDDRSNRALFVSARLRPGVAIDAAQAELHGVAAALEREWPATNRGRDVNVRPLQEEFVGPQARLVFALLAGMVLIVLIIGCVNVANLLLARGVARRGEFALRLALGAGGWRVVGQLLGEAGLLAIIGGVLSLAVSRWTFHVLMSLGAVDSEWLDDNGMNVRVFAVTAVMSVVAAVGAGFAPAMAARRANLATALQSTSRAAVRSVGRATRVLVGAQVALAVALLVVGGLGTRTLMALEDLDAGFDLENVLTASVTLPDGISNESGRQFFERTLSRVRQLPGVVSAGATSRLPFAGGRWNPNRGLEIEGQPQQEANESRFAVDYVVTPGLLESLRVPLRRGRMFTDADGPGAPLVAVVSEAMVQRFWYGRSPLGARLRQGDDPTGGWRTVVGVVGDVRNDDADQPPLPYIYVPFSQQPRRTMTLAMRTTSRPEGYASALRAAIGELDPAQPLYDIRTMRDVWEADLQGTRTLIQIMGALAAIALGLAGLGVWGVAAHAVGQRTQEIGLRVALGATAGQVGGLVARQGLMPVAAGLAAGLVAGLGLAQLMRSILFRVTPTDATTIVGTLAVLAFVATIATLGPTLRASRLDPVAALRGDRH